MLFLRNKRFHSCAFRAKPQKLFAKITLDGRKRRDAAAFAEKLLFATKKRPRKEGVAHGVCTGGRFRLCICVPKGQ